MKQYIVSTVDKIILVPKIKRSFSNTEDWKFILSAGKPVLIGDNVDDGEIPREVAKIYSESYRHIYSITDSAAKVSGTPQGPAPTGSNSDDFQFDAVAFLESTPEPTEADLSDMRQKQLLEVCAVLGLSGTPHDSKKLLSAKIVQEIKVRSGTAAKGD